jgi:ParB family chromosome partitioning protein
MSKLSKFERMSALAPALGAIPAVVQKGSDDDQVLEFLSLSEVTPDPDNPRRIGLDPANPRLIRDDDPNRVRKARVLAGIEDLAVSIENNGLEQPVTVYRHGPVYRLVSGERRYWACKLAGLQTIKAIPLPGRPENVREKQYAENVHRVELSASERFENVQAIIAERKKRGLPINNAKDLMKPLAVRQTQAYEWWALLQAPTDVHEALLDDRITTIERAVTIAKIGNQAERARAIETGEIVTAPVQSEPARKAPKKVRGRPVKAVNLGKAQSPDVVRFVLGKLLGKQLPNDVDWSDYRAVSELFRKTIKDIGARLAKGADA